MSREESDREDLLREATAMPERIEVQLEDEPESWFAGFRRNGAFSLYAGPQRVFQFNTQGELRRGYRDGRLIKADGRQLIWMDRRREGERTVLVSRPFTPEETEGWLAEWKSLQRRLEAGWDNGSIRIVGAAPEADAVSERVRAWLRTTPPPAIAERPNA